MAHGQWYAVFSCGGAVGCSAVVAVRRTAAAAIHSEQSTGTADSSETVDRAGCNLIFYEEIAPVSQPPPHTHTAHGLRVTDDYLEYV